MARIGGLFGVRSGIQNWTPTGFDIFNVFDGDATASGAAGRRVQFDPVPDRLRRLESHLQYAAVKTREELRGVHPGSYGLPNRVGMLMVIWDDPGAKRRRKFASMRHLL